MFEINSAKKGKATKRPASMSVDDDPTATRVNKKKKNEATVDLSTAFRAAFKHNNSKHDAPKRKEQNHTKEAKKSIKTMQVSSQKEVKLSSSSTKQNGSHARGLSQLQLKFQKKLEGARFRALNEKLYSAK